MFDLQYDPQDFLELSEDALVSVMISSRKALRYVAANKQPILMPANFARESLSRNADEEIRRRAALVAGAREFQERVGAALARRFCGREAGHHVEERIHEGFTTAQDSALLRKFHQLPWEGRGEVLDQLGDPRLRELGYRLIYVERPDVLPYRLRDELNAWRGRRLMGEPTMAPWRTLLEAIIEAHDLALCADPPDPLAFEVKGWLEQFRDSVIAKAA